MVEVFGGTLALLIIILILINVVTTQNIKAMLDRSTESAKYEVSWSDGSEGYVVVTHTDKIRILETNQSILRNDLCKPGSAFLDYIDRIYNNPEKKQIIFAVTVNSVSTVAVARNCLRQRYINRAISIGWIIASQDLLSTVRLEKLPARIKRTLGKEQ